MILLKTKPKRFSQLTLVNPAKAGTTVKKLQQDDHKFKEKTIEVKS